jgi:uncharacterized protein with HEPN domain
MLEAAQDAINFAHGRMREDLGRDRMLALAIIKSIEIIGEAASKITEDFKSTHGNIPWNDIVNMRHRLTHAYFDVNLDIVWKTVENDLPDLISTLKKIISVERV